MAERSKYKIMNDQICPFRGAGEKKCKSNCAIITPMGCSIKVIALELALKVNRKSQKDNPVKPDKKVDK